ncbi:MAG: O-antigen ligase family protein [Solirubrobacterales bacterium]|jgi:O-antigen ligase
MSQTAHRLGQALARGAVFCLFLGVPLAASPLFWDQFTTVKWYVLEALASLWLLAEVLLLESGHGPSFVRRHRVGCALVGSFLAASCFRLGPQAAWAPLLDRAVFAVLVLCFLWFLSRDDAPLRTVSLAVGLAALLADAYGLAQVAGLQPLPFLTAGDQRSAFFGNVNLTAQFLGLAVIFLITALTGERARLLRALGEGTVALSLAYLYFLSSRSVALALTCAVGACGLVRRPALGSLARVVLGAALVAWFLSGPGGAAPSPGAEAGGAGYLHAVREHKWLTVVQRFHIWEGTLELVRDHPLGVGAGNFGDLFLAYGGDVPLVPREEVVFLHPHNEYLRALAEEGLILVAVALYLFLRLLLDLRAKRDPGLWRSPAGLLLLGASVFLSVEGFFQFPLATAFGALTVTLLLGLALRLLEPFPESPSASGRARTVVSVTVVAVAVILVLLYRVAASEYLFVNRRDDLAAQARACRLNSRNLPACVTAAWLEAGTGKVGEARRRLVHLLERAPRYFPAIKLLAEIALEEGDLEAGCLYLGAYDVLFREGSSLHGKLVEQGCDRAALRATLARAAWPRGSIPFAPADAAVAERAGR